MLDGEGDERAFLNSQTGGHADIGLAVQHEHFRLRELFAVRFGGIEIERKFQHVFDTVRVLSDKLSALEVTGQLAIDKPAARTPAAKVDLGPPPKDPFGDVPRGTQAEQARSLPTASEPATHPKSLPPLTVPEKSKGLEL